MCCMHIHTYIYTVYTHTSSMTLHIHSLSSLLQWNSIVIIHKKSVCVCYASDCVRGWAWEVGRSIHRSRTPSSSSLPLLTSGWLSTTEPSVLFWPAAGGLSPTVTTLAPLGPSSSSGGGWDTGMSGVGSGSGWWAPFGVCLGLCAGHDQHKRWHTVIHIIMQPSTQQHLIGCRGLTIHVPALYMLNGVPTLLLLDGLPVKMSSSWSIAPLNMILFSKISRTFKFERITQPQAK